MRHGLVKNPLLNILEFLVVILMHMFKRKIGLIWIIKSKSVSLLVYKDGIQGYKIWNLVTKKTIYSRDVVFREVKYVPKQEVLPKEK
jgi:hypothetical protein